MEKKKIALTVLGCALTLSGLIIWLVQFFNKVHEKQVYRDELAEASSQAVEYVRAKYGIEPELVDIAEGSWYARNNQDPSEESVIPMKANGREFYVKSQLNDNGIERGDNYQWNEIEAAIAAEIGKIVPGGEAVDIYAHNIFSNDSLFRLKYVFSEYYDGTNIEELLKNSGGNVEMVFPNGVDIAASGLCEKLREWGMTYKLTVFDTAERAKEFAERLRRLNEDDVYLSQSNFGNYAPLYEIYAPYIDKSYAYYSEDEGGAKTIDYDLYSFDDFMVSRDGCSYGESGEIAKWFGYYDEQNAVGKPISKEYMFENGYGNVAIYYPLEKFDGMDINKVGLAWFTKDSYITNNRDIARAEICGGYVVFLIYSPDNDLSFMLVDIDGQEDYVPEWKRNRS